MAAILQTQFFNLVPYIDWNLSELGSQGCNWGIVMSGSYKGLAPRRRQFTSRIHWHLNASLGINEVITVLLVNKANLRDLIAATGLAILLTLDSIFSVRMILKLVGWIRKTIGLLLCATSSLSHHFKAKKTVNSNWSYSPEMLNSGQLFVTCNLEIWWIILKNNRAPLLCYFKLCASFCDHRSIQIRVTVRKRSIRVKIGDFYALCDLEIWRMTLKDNRAPLQ